MPNAERLLTPDDVAAYLQLPKDTLTQWRYLRKGPRYVRIGRHVRYRQADVDKWLTARSHGQVPA